MELSIIVPVYRVEKYLKGCVNSILASTYRDYELILVDDGSPDTCGEICDRYADTDARIKVIHKKNGGLSSARNAALDIASGTYVAFVDSDDRVKPEMFERMVGALKEEDADVVCCGMPLLRDDGLKTPFIDWPAKQQTYLGTDALELLVSRKGTGDFYMNKVYRRSLFDGIRMPEGKIFEDVYTMHLVFAKSRKTIFLPDGYYEYRYNLEGISHAKKRHPRFLDYVTAAGEQYAYIRENCPKFEVQSKEKYVRAILQTAEGVVLERGDEKKQIVADLRALLLAVGDLSDLPRETFERSKYLKRGFRALRNHCRAVAFYEKQHRHPKFQAILRLFIR